MSVCRSPPDTSTAVRRRPAEELGPLDYDGYAIGGLSVGEERGRMFEAAAAAALLSASPE